MNPLITTSLSGSFVFLLASCNILPDLSQIAFYGKTKPVNSPVVDRQQPNQSQSDRSKVKLKKRREMLNSQQIISAQVILVAATGARIDGNTSITAQNIETYRPSELTVQTVSQYFRERGFEVFPLVGISFTISAPVQHFSEFFKTSVIQDGAGRILAGERLELPLNSLEKNIADSITSATFVPSPDFGPTNFNF